MVDNGDHTGSSMTAFRWSRLDGAEEAGRWLAMDNGHASLWRARVVVEQKRSRMEREEGGWGNAYKLRSPRPVSAAASSR